MKKITAAYKDQFEIEILSGGMMIEEQTAPIDKIAPFIQSAYKRVEALTGIKFGEDFLWHINNPEESDSWGWSIRWSSCWMRLPVRAPRDRKSVV